MQLNVRASGIRRTLGNMQRSVGNLNAAIQEPADLMNNYMEGARDALSQNDPAAAQSFMKKAEAAIEKLEKTLNR